AGLLGRLEEAERAQHAVVGLDEVVAGKARQLTELRDERLVDLADDLVRARRVDTFVATNGGMHVKPFCCSYRTERPNERAAAVRPGSQSQRNVQKPRRLQH